MVLDESAGREEKTNNTHDVVPRIDFQREEIGGDGLPHVALRVERHQHTEDDGQADRHPCANPTVCADAQMVDEILRGDVPLRITGNESFNDVHIF